jgi:hypothetical protein
MSISDMIQQSLEAKVEQLENGMAKILPAEAKLLQMPVRQVS